jgi:hypothetical protein
MNISSLLIKFKSTNAVYYFLVDDAEDKILKQALYVSAIDSLLSN